MSSFYVFTSELAPKLLDSLRLPLRHRLSIRLLRAQPLHLLRVLLSRLRQLLHFFPILLCARRSLCQLTFKFRRALRSGRQFIFKLRKLLARGHDLLVLVVHLRLGLLEEAAGVVQLLLQVDFLLLLVLLLVTRTAAVARGRPAPVALAVVL